MHFNLKIKIKFLGKLQCGEEILYARMRSLYVFSLYTSVIGMFSIERMACLKTGKSIEL